MSQTRYLTTDEKRELVEALVLRFRTGEIGPLTFRRDATAYLDHDEITECIAKFSGDCATNWRNRS